MWLRAVLLLATVAFVVSTTTVEEPHPKLDQSRFVGTKSCCLEMNVYSDIDDKCFAKNTEFQIECPLGKYLLDPIKNKDDIFYINEKYQIYLGKDESGYLIDNSFCTTNLHDNSSTSDRPVAFICFMEEFQPTNTISTIKGILGMISAAFVLATLYVYYLLPDMRTTQDKVTMVLLTCMMIFLLSLGILQIYTEQRIWCHTIAFVTYFFTIAYFTWMNLVMLNVWKTSVCVRWQIKERTWYILNHVYGWTLPIVLTANLYVQMDTHYGHHQTCFVNEGRSTWLFLYLPIALMLFLNVVLFVWSAITIHMSGQDVSPDRKRALAYKLRLYVQLALMSGLTWFLELLSSYCNDDKSIINAWIVADVINLLLGVFVFLVLVVFRRRIRKELAGKRILCFRAPENWANNIAIDEDYLQNTEHEILRQTDIQP